MLNHAFEVELPSFEHSERFYSELKKSIENISERMDRFTTVYGSYEYTRIMVLSDSLNKMKLIDMVSEDYQSLYSELLFTIATLGNKYLIKFTFAKEE